MSAARLASKRARAFGLVIVFTLLAVLPFRLLGVSWPALLYWCIAIPVCCVFAYVFVCCVEGDVFNHNNERDGI